MMVRSKHLILISLATRQKQTAPRRGGQLWLMLIEIIGCGEGCGWCLEHGVEAF